MKEIYLIRHGKTEANEKHLYCGSTDLPLSAEGERALQNLHYSVGDALFFTSGMLRTEQTLMCLFGDVPHCAVEDLREIDFGKFEMQSYEQLKSDADYQAWISGDNHRNIPPCGESGEQMTKRVLQAFEKLTEHEAAIVVITHGGVIAAIMEHYFPEEGKNLYAWQPAPGYGYHIQNGTYHIVP